MARKLFITSVVLMILLAPACKQRNVWMSTPIHQTLNSRSFDVGLQPVKKNADYFNWFRLTVKNKTAGDLEIDWNRTRYIHNGKDAGLFIFEGVVPESVKNSTIPTAVIPAGSTLTRDIAPFRLIAFAPLREQTIDTERPNITAGVIPEGENGLRLVILQSGKVARPRISVEIKTRDSE